MNQYLPDWQPSKSHFVRLGLATECRHLSVISGGLVSTRPAAHLGPSSVCPVGAVKETRFTVIQGNLAAWIALYRTCRTHGNSYWTFGRGSFVRLPSRDTPFPLISFYPPPLTSYTL